MIISFIGFMGSGKTTVAKKISSLFYSSHIDLDACIEKNERKSISEIFKQDGEEYFRAMEEKYIRNIIGEALNPENAMYAHKSPVFLSLGGGAVISAISRELIKGYTYCIYMKVSADTIVERLRKAGQERPLISGLSRREMKNKILKLYKERIVFYEDCASLIIETDNLSSDETVKLLADIISSKLSTSR